MPIENRTARLTILIDPRKKAVFERLCANEDTTPSQVVRRLIREYIERATGRPWHAEDEVLVESVSKKQEVVVSKFDRCPRKASQSA